MVNLRCYDIIIIYSLLGGKYSIQIYDLMPTNQKIKINKKIKLKYYIKLYQ